MANRITLKDAVDFVTASDDEEYSELESEFSESEDDSSESDMDIKFAVPDEEVCCFLFSTGTLFFC